MIEETERVIWYGVAERSGSPIIKHILTHEVPNTLRDMGKTSLEYAGAVVAKTAQGKPHSSCPTSKVWMFGAKNVRKMKQDRRARAPRRTRFCPKIATR